MPTATIQINSPVTLADGQEHDIAFKVDAFYSIPQEDGIWVLGYSNIEAALTIAGIDVTLVGTDESRLFDSWLAYAPKTGQSRRDWIKNECMTHWNHTGRERFFRDAELRNIEDRADATAGR